MSQRLLEALIATKNEAADGVLLEALDRGNDTEKRAILEALIRRENSAGLGGVVARFPQLSDELKTLVLENIKAFYTALRESGRSPDVQKRLSALRLIALGRLGKLAYVLSENLHAQDEDVAKISVEALVALSRWVAVETKNLHRGIGFKEIETGTYVEPSTVKLYNDLMANREEIEATVARAIDLHRGKQAPELLRAALLVADWPGSKTLAILHTTKHGAQSLMVRRLQQVPASEHVDAFLLGATHGGLRSHFGVVFAHINEAPVLDALLRKTHWLKDNQLQICMHQVANATWLGDGELARDIERRTTDDAAKVGEWIAVSGAHDVMQDQRLTTILERVSGDFGAKLRLVRIAAGRKRGTSCALLNKLVSDSDERIARLAAREIVRRKPQDFENTLLQLMTGAPDSIRRVVSRSIGQAGFEHFWQRFDRLDKITRKSAGKAMMKLLPDAAARLSRRLTVGGVDQQLKAMQIAQELEVAEQLKPILVRLCEDPDAKLRSKAISVLGELPTPPADALLDRVLVDQDARVRANAIEVLENKRREDYVPLLAQRARSAHNRERANAIKALHKMRITAAVPSLASMLKDQRPEHRISALWALRQMGFWSLLHEVGKIAKGDENLRVRRYALGVLRGVAEMLQTERKAG